MDLAICDTKSINNKRKNINWTSLQVKAFVLRYNFADSQTLSVLFYFSLGDIHPRALHSSIDKKVNFLEISISVIKVEAKSGLKNLTKPKVNLKPKVNSRQRHLLVIFVNRQFRKEIEDFITEIQ